jgi:hypothetical protein
VQHHLGHAGETVEFGAVVAQVGIGHGAIVGQVGASRQISRAQRQTPRALMGLAILGLQMPVRLDGGRASTEASPARELLC